MLSAREAYDIAKKGYKYPQLLSCLDFGNFYLFAFAPFMMDISEGYLTGTKFDAVDKRTGNKFLYDVSTNIDSYEKAKEIKIKTIIDKVVKI